MDQLLQLNNESKTLRILGVAGARIFFIKAGITSGVTNGSGRIGLDQQRILIAIFQNFHHMQEITALLSFGPKPVFGAAEKGHFSLFPGPVQCLGVHKP